MESLHAVRRKGYTLTTHRALCRRASIWIGQTCNLRCKFCYFKDRIADRNHPEHTFMPLEKLKDMCRTLVDVYGNNTVDIEGGEPTIYRDIVPLVAYCRSIGLKPTLITNAFALTDLRKCEELRDAGLFDFLVSIHSIGEAYDSVVQVPGAFTKLVAGIDNCRKAGIPFRFNTVLCPEALPHLMEIAQLTVEKGARVHNFINYNPFVDQNLSGKRSRDRVPRYTDVARQLMPVIDYLDANDIEVNVRYMPFCSFPESYRKHVQNFQQIVYDLHEWESAGEAWSGAKAQRETLAPLDPPLDFFGRLYARRQQYFAREVQQARSGNGYEFHLDLLMKDFEEKTRNTSGPLSLALYGNSEVNLAVSQAVNENPALAGKFLKPVFVSSADHRQCDEIFGHAWRDDQWLRQYPADVVGVTANLSRFEIYNHLREMGLAERTILMFERSASGRAFEKLFYLPELGPVEGFSDMEYAYKEYRVVMAKTMHPYDKGDKCRSCSLVGICDGYHRDYANFFGSDEARPEDFGKIIRDPRYYMKDQRKIVEQEEYDWALPNESVSHRKAC